LISGSFSKPEISQINSKGRHNGNNNPRKEVKSHFRFESRPIEAQTATKGELIDKISKTFRNRSPLAAASL
jgi:hypothetical protein